MDVLAPEDAPVEVDWVVPERALVAYAEVLAWLRSIDHCGLRPLLAPRAGPCVRRTSLLPLAAPGTLLAVVGAPEERLAAEARAALVARRAQQAEALEALERRTHQSPLHRALLEADARRLRSWLAQADAALTPAEGPGR